MSIEGIDQWRIETARLSLADRDSPEARVVQRLPSLEQVLALFARLTCGGGGDLFICGEPGERDLGVSGGPTLFLVSCTGELYGSYNLVDPASGRDGWLTLHVGGVSSSVEAYATVASDFAERAIRFFYSRGSIDPELRWE